MSVPTHRYHGLSIAAHWLTLALLIVLYALIELRGLAPKGSDLRDAIKMWHGMFGLTVLCLTAIRLTLRLTFRAPPITPPPSPRLHKLSRATHAALYGFLIAAPLLGWLTLSAQGKPVPFFGFEWPALIAPDKALGHSLEDIHGTLGTLGYFLIGLHALAALYHHYFMRDDTLVRMLPTRGNARKSSGS